MKLTWNTVNNLLSKPCWIFGKQYYDCLKPNKRKLSEEKKEMWLRVRRFTKWKASSQSHPLGRIGKVNLIELNQFRNWYGTTNVIYQGLVSIYRHCFIIFPSYLERLPVYHIRTRVTVCLCICILFAGLPLVRHLSSLAISMMTSSNGNIFRVTGHFCGEFTDSPHKGQWRRALMFSLICVWIKGWENNREAGDLRRYRAHYDVIVMSIWCWCYLQNADCSHSCPVGASIIGLRVLWPLWSLPAINLTHCDIAVHMATIIMFIIRSPISYSIQNVKDFRKMASYYQVVVATGFWKYEAHEFTHSAITGGPQTMTPEHALLTITWGVLYGFSQQYGSYWCLGIDLTLWLLQAF